MQEIVQTAPVVDQQGSVSSLAPSIAPAAPSFTDIQLGFIEAYIENGGKAGEAALTAGASHETYGIRLLAKKKVQDEIARRVKLQAGSALHISLTRLLKIVESSTDDKAAVQAALGLMDRFGMAAPKGPSVALQVNNNTTVIGGQAQSIIGAIWADRQARLGQNDL